MLSIQYEESLTSCGPIIIFLAISHTFAINVLLRTNNIVVCPNIHLMLQSALGCPLTITVVSIKLHHQLIIYTCMKAYYTVELCNTSSMIAFFTLLDFATSG